MCEQFTNKATIQSWVLKLKVIFTQKYLSALL